MTALTIGGHLKRVRLSADFTQAKLAEALGVTQSFVSKIELDDSEPSLRFAIAWAHACGWTVRMEPRDPEVTP